MNQRQRTRRYRLALVAIALALALACAEAIARVALAFLDAQPTHKPAVGAQVELIDMIRPAAHPDIVYELQAGLDCVYRGVPVQTNSAGWRGPEVPIDKPRDGFRVVALGDSVLFGWGVPWSESIVPQLEQRLKAALPSHQVAVIGTGVPGYNTAMEATVLREKGLRYQPDIVLVDFVGNDFDLPNFLLAPVDLWRVDHCYLLDLAKRAWHSTWTSSKTRFAWAPMADAGRYESDPLRVPSQYRHLVGPAAYARALREIVDLGRRHGFRVLVSTHHALSTQAQAICQEVGVPMQDTYREIEAWLAQHGHSEYRGSPLTLSASDPHPSSLLHTIWADVLFDKLRSLGWLPRSR